MRFLIDGAAVPSDAAAYERIVLLFDGEDPDAVETARARWQEAKGSGFDVYVLAAGRAGALAAQGLSSRCVGRVNHPDFAAKLPQNDPLI